MIISIITVVFNCKEFIGHCLTSVQSQTYPQVEHIVIDGGSTDGTLAVIDKHPSDRMLVFSETDSGYYDGLNKGIMRSTGNVIATLNADDEFSDNYVVENMVNCFKRNQCEAVYGNLNYVKRLQTNLVIRHWQGLFYNVNRFNYGWMPPHPTIFFKKHLFTSYGVYSLNYGSSADYDLVIRFMYVQHAKTFFLDRVIVKMRAGGMSNGSLTKMVNASLRDYEILRSHHFRMCWMVLALKKLRKLGQFTNL